jgi:hypothetical protein
VLAVVAVEQLAVLRVPVVREVAAMVRTIAEQQLETLTQAAAAALKVKMEAATAAPA